jgi:DNA-binding winged helix-turn-helix (wHTH) protein/dienelactone hydrolase
VDVVYRFNGFTVDPVRRLLFAPNGQAVALKSRVFDVLLELVEHRGQLLEKQALLDAVWPHAVVEENNLTQAISTLRGVFGETRGEHRFIVTEPGRGYRFVACVEAASADPRRTGPQADASPTEVQAAAPAAPPATRPAPPAKPARRPVLVLAAALVSLGALGAAGWSWQRAAAERLARTETIPGVARLVDAGDFEAAFTLAAKAKQRVSYDPLLERLTPQFAATFSVTTEPAGAAVYVRGYGDSSGDWRPLGTAPLAAVQVPRIALRWRFEKAGFRPAERVTTAHDDSFGPGRIDVALLEPAVAPDDMVLVPGGDVRRRLSVVPIAMDNLPPYLLDRFEVTNQAFKKFVDAGGYRDARYWDGLALVRDGVELRFDQAVRQLVDAAGQPGPAGWDLGNYPAGEGDRPVTGVSRYEAAAYAKFVGKQLPSVYHWTKAAVEDTELGVSLEALSVPLSNFGSTGPVAVGSRQGIGPFGTYDMHGNVREWISNGGGALGGWVLGGGFEDAEYTFNSAIAADPLTRSSGIGFRLMRAVGDEPIAAAALAPVELVVTRNTALEPVSADVFARYRALYDYVPAAELHASEPETVETTPDWIKQRVVIDTAAGERMAVFLFVPRDVAPKAQALIFFPGIDRFYFRLPEESVQPGYNVFPLDWVMRSGRVLVAPTFQGSYARFKSRYDPTDAFRMRREWIERRWDLGRTLDYLEQRGDVDASRIGYIGVSAGGSIALPLLALEQRLRTAVLVSGGLPFEGAPPETEPVNFAPRITLPVLMLNGRYDFRFTVEGSQRPLFELLGTSPEDKRYYALDGGHATLPRAEAVRLALDWLDCYLGPVHGHERVRSTDCRRADL